MFWTKIGILVIGALYAILLPYSVYKIVVRLKFNVKEYTLSFLSNKRIYDKKIADSYTFLLLATAFLHYVFFWLLINQYSLGWERKLLSYLDYSVAGLTLLACLRHNMLPLSFKTLRATLLRIGHNITAVVVFLTLPSLIIVFQSIIIDTHKLSGIGGFIIIGLTILFTVISVIRQGINGITEIIFISGISMWSIFISLTTIFFA